MNHTETKGIYNGLMLNGYSHYRIFHSNNEFARGKNHVNGIEKTSGIMLRID
jgi:hypothetical protein